VVDVERNSQAGVVGGKIMEDTVSREEFNAMKHQLEGVIKDLEEEMMMLQARIAVYLP
jgi:exonuclease VII small subunit